MKSFLFVLSILIAHAAFGQYLLNGSFENNTYGNGCHTGQSNALYNWFMNYSTSFSSTVGEIDVIQGDLAIPTDSCFFFFFGGGAQEGEGYIGIAAIDTTYVFGTDSVQQIWQDAFTLQLYEPLVVGNWYELSFFTKDPPHLPDGFPPHYTTRIELGISESDTLFGEWIHTSAWPDTLWSQQTVVFQANITALHISCRPIFEQSMAGIFVDNFELTPLVGVPSLCQSKQLLRIIDVLGREVPPRSNTPLFYLYDDGTVEKRITFSD